MVSFEVGKEIEKDIFRLVTWVGQRKNSESLWGVEPQTFGSRAPVLYHRCSMVREIYYEVHMTRFLHTVRISNVDSFMFVNSKGKMVSFERGKEIEKGVPVFVTTVGQRKNSESPWGIEPQTLVTLVCFDRTSTALYSTCKAPIVSGVVEEGV